MLVALLLLAITVISTGCSVGGAVPASPPRSGSLRLLSYNIQWGMGADGVRDLDRIVEQLRRIDADIVILNEVDDNWRRSGNVNQPTAIARRAGYEHHHFGPALTTWASGNHRLSKYGNVLLSRFPIQSVRTVALPVGPGREPRSAIVARLDVGGRPFVVIGTHLGLHAGDRLRQTAALRKFAQEETARARSEMHPKDAAKRADIPVVIMGDFNARPGAPEIVQLQGEAPAQGGAIRLFDAHDLAGEGDAHTFPFPEPYARIDYVFVSSAVADAVVAAKALPVPGSDHLPVVVDLASFRSARYDE